MSLPSDTEDSHWLEALAGKPANAADPKVNRQAMALRKALQARKDEIEKIVPEADAALYQQIRFRLRREKEAIEERADDWDAESAPMFSRGNGGIHYSKVSSAMDETPSRVSEPVSFWRRPSSWAIAASLVLGVSLVVNMKGLLPEADESTIIRGTGQASVLIVADPEVRLAELLQGLAAAKAEPKVERPSKGKIQLKLKATQEALDYLDTQRINPKVVEGQVVLLITTQPAKP